MTPYAEQPIGVPRRTVAPTLLPVTLDSAKVHIGIDGDSSNDARVTDLLWQAVEQIENDANIVIMTQTWQQHYDKFPLPEIELKLSPIQSVTHIKYITGGVLTTWASSNYQTDLYSVPARIKPIATASWPAPDTSTVNAVQVEFVAGYATVATVPRYTQHVVLQVVKMLFYGCEMGDTSYWPMINRLRKTGFV